MKNIVDFLEINATKYANKIAYTDSENEIDYQTLNLNAKKIASYILSRGYKRSPIVLFIDKNIRLIESIFGSLYSGNFYTIIDTQMPEDRIISIFSSLKPALIVYDKIYEDKVKSLQVSDIVDVTTCLDFDICENLISQAQNELIDTDLAYALYTSGSTGVPKRVA